jgi:hypothetical protein
VEVYDAFHKILFSYLLPVMPFDCISIKMGYEALCPPGLGLPCYAVIARVLMEHLPQLLSCADAQVYLLVNMLFRGRCEEKREEDVRVCQLGFFWQGTRNRFQNPDFSAVFPQ